AYHLFPIGALSHRRVGEEAPDQVAPVWGCCCRNGEERVGGFVPCQVVPPPSHDIRRSWVKISQHPLEYRTDRLLHGECMRRERLPGEQKKMPAFIQRQPERLSKAFQHLCRGMNIAPLLSPDVPGGANCGAT